MTGLEPGRPKAGFYATIHRDNETSNLPGHVLQDVYDIAINSMDFGSEFLSTEEVANLRALGKAIGAEPFHYGQDECVSCGHTSKQHDYPPPRKCRVWTYPYDQPKCQCEGWVSPG